VFRFPGLLLQIRNNVSTRRCFENANRHSDVRNEFARIRKPAIKIVCGPDQIRAGQRLRIIVVACKVGSAANDATEHWSALVAVKGMACGTTLTEKFLAYDSVWFGARKKARKILGLVKIS